jgi:hypothetical protein
LKDFVTQQHYIGFQLRTLPLAGELVGMGAAACDKMSDNIRVKEVKQ